MDQFLSALYGKDLIAFGTGGMGKLVIPYLAQSKEIRLCGVTNSRVHEADGGKYLDTGIPIRSIDTWAELMPRATILVVATKARHQAEILDLCRQAGFQDILFATLEWINNVISAPIKAYMAQKGEPLDDMKCITFGDLHLLGPACLPRSEDIKSFWMELKEFILPTLYPDWAVPPEEEGPYLFRHGSELQSGDVVLDCGSNLGLFSAFAASRGCKSYAFEPTPELHTIIRKNGRLNGDSVVLVDAAVADTTGTTEFYICGNDFEANSLLADQARPFYVDGEPPKTLQVCQVTIDDFVEKQDLRHVDFIKADIEGAERLMLAGAQRTLKRFSPRLSICTYHLPDDKEVLTNLIKRANPQYEIEYRWEKLYAEVPKRQIREGER